MSGTYSYEVESYAIITNVEKSILKFNPVLKSYGYEFVRISLQELDQKFCNLFGLAPDFKSESIGRMSHYDGETPTNRSIREVIEEWQTKQLEKGIAIEQTETIISGELHEMLTHTIYNGIKLLMQKELFFLKRIENFNQEVINYGFDGVIAFQVNIEMSAFVEHLVQQLRLLKNGDVTCKTIFQIAAESRKVIQRYNPVFLPGGGRKLIISDEDIHPFNLAIASKLSINHLTELALTNFNIAYQIPEMRSKYLMLMICLESLFNTGSGEIAHTISRHLAIT